MKYNQITKKETINRELALIHLYRLIIDLPNEY